jgi:hypothetical protein
MRYELYDLKTGYKVGQLEQDGTLICENPQARRDLERVIGRELLTREDEEEYGEVVEEGDMCYLGQRSVRPQDADYLAVLVRQLPILTNYEARPVNLDSEG